MKRNRDFENEKIERLYVTREMAEDKEMDEKIRQDLIRAADEAEKASQEEEALGTSIPMGAEEKQQLFDDIVNELKRKGIWEEDPEETDGDRSEKGTSPCPARPEDQLSAEDQEALRLGRELLHTPQKKKSTILPKILKGITGAAVVALGVFVLSMSSEANREKILSVWNSIVGNELRVDFDNDTRKEVSLDNEEKMHREIYTKLGIKPINFFYMPEKLLYQSGMIDEVAGIANLFYSYCDTTISVSMCKQNNEIRQNQQFDGMIMNTIKIFPQEIETSIYVINGENNSYVATFVYDNCYYQIWGEMQQKEFEKLINGIKI